MLEEFFKVSLRFFCNWQILPAWQKVKVVYYNEFYKNQLEYVDQGTQFGGPHITIYGGKKGRSKGISIGSNCVIYDYCQFYCDDLEGSGIQIGNNCYFNFGSYICGSGGLIIGNDCIIGPHVQIIPMNHNFDDLETKIVDQGHSEGTIILEDNVWLGAGAIILPKVRINSGAIVGAGAVVTKDVEKNMIVAGVPAVPLRHRGSTGIENIPTVLKN